MSKTFLLSIRNSIKNTKKAYICGEEINLWNSAYKTGLMEFMYVRLYTLWLLNLSKYLLGEKTWRDFQLYLYI